MPPFLCKSNTASGSLLTPSNWERPIFLQEIEVLDFGIVQGFLFYMKVYNMVMLDCVKKRKAFDG